MTAQIILTTAGANTGPTFDLFSDVDGFLSAFETEIPKASLLAGYTTSLVPDGTTIIRVCSHEGICYNCVDIPLIPMTTSTTTTEYAPINALVIVIVGIPDTRLGYTVMLSNFTGIEIWYRLRIQNVTKGGGFNVGPRIVVPDGTLNGIYTGVIQGYPFANSNGDIINAELSDDDGVTWTASLYFPPPYTLPYGA